MASRQPRLTPLERSRVVFRRSVNYRAGRESLEESRAVLAGYHSDQIEKQVRVNRRLSLSAQIK